MRLKCRLGLFMLTPIMTISSRSNICHILRSKQLEKTRRGSLPSLFLLRGPFGMSAMQGLIMNLLAK